MNAGSGAVVVIASEHSLVAQSVCAALSGHGLRATIIGWPYEAQPSAAAASCAPAGVVISELDPPPRLEEVRRLLQRQRSRWVVLTGSPREPLWGAVVAAGAASVLPDTTGLDELVSVLSQLLAGHPVMSEAERQELVASWLGWMREGQRLEARLQLLSPSERTVLEMLHRGETVRAIAAERAVSEATVRFQVRTILRKLEVSSQLAAVAAFDSRRGPQLHFSE